MLSIRRLKKELAKETDPDGRRRIRELILSGKTRRRRTAISMVLAMFALLAVALYFEPSIVVNWKGKRITLGPVPKGGALAPVSWCVFVRKGTSLISQPRILAEREGTETAVEAKAYFMFLPAPPTVILPGMYNPLHSRRVIVAYLVRIDDDGNTALILGSDGSKMTLMIVTEPNGRTRVAWGQTRTLKPAS